MAKPLSALDVGENFLRHSGDTKFYPTLDISQNVLRHFEVTKPLFTLDVCKCFSRHSELCEESVSKSIAHVQDSSVTSFPQNDDCNLRHCEVAKPLSTLDVCKCFSRHSEQSEESISKPISNLKDSSVTSFPQNDDYVLDMANDCSSPLPMGDGALGVAEAFSPHPTGSRKTAFTLAEILIILGIIGVVAAMTMPNLINQTRNKELQVQFKKVYAELNQVAQLFVKDNEISVTDYVITSGTVNFVKREAPKYFSGFQMTDDTIFSSVDTDGNKKTSAYQTYTLSGTKLRMGPCDDLGFRTEIGGRIYSFVGDKVQEGTQGPVVCVDVNGQKKPNKYGYDIFLFRFTQNGFVLPMGQKITENEGNYGGVGDAISNNFFISSNCKSTSSVRDQASCAYFALSDRHPTDSRKNYWQDFLGTSR